MPATRKARTSTGHGPAAKGTQKTLAFNNSKISKASDVKEKTYTPPPTDVLEKVVATAQVDVQPKPEAAKVVSKERTEEEVRALKVSDAQIKKYWKMREAERISPRVHQEDLSVEEKVLRLFDMSSQFGPCIGTPRMKRWIRANRLNLSPPIEVLAVLLKEEEKGHTESKRAYVDELMSSKQVD